MQFCCRFREFSQPAVGFRGLVCSEFIPRFVIEENHSQSLDESSPININVLAHLIHRVYNYPSLGLFGFFREGGLKNT